MKTIWTFVKQVWKVSPAYVLLILLNGLIGGGKIILNMVLPMFLIDELIGGRDVKKLILFGACIVANNVIMTFITDSLQKYRDVKDEWVQNVMVEKLGERIMNLEYSYLENTYYLDLKERAIFAVQNQSAIVAIITLIANTVQGVITLAGLMVILFTLGPVLMTAIAIGVALMILIVKAASGTMVALMNRIIPINRIFGYYAGVAADKPAQKDLRLYHMDKLVTEKIRQSNETTCDEFDVANRKMGLANGANGVITEFISAFTYGYVGIRTISDMFGSRITLGSLTMYVSSAITFSSTIIQFGENLIGLWQNSQFLVPYQEFMALKEETIEDGGVPMDDIVETLEFRNVSFTYPKAEKPVLKNVSFAVKKGEKISIVGLNGAGKSTLVKLICRMYKADSGEILVNGRDIYDYDYLSYMNVISAVFQDYKLFNFTIEENISCRESGADENRVNYLIDEVGMREKIDTLPEGIHSRFGKEYDEDGVELSGGQGQKIAIARALYKKASMVILDEPASALDPIAEAEIYEKFNSLVEDKTAIYISHRMSSSVFCDRILIIDGGTVSDFDTHENLMKKTDSLYYKLFTSQAENYKLAIEQ
ncbi:MAG: ABC transporter ATP-binding protein/permease [Lachnobacterium sp.]|nr:ABC transporter ATP-binding protein/permease [Lachnobacterium sp.]